MSSADKNLNIKSVAKTPIFKLGLQNKQLLTSLGLPMKLPSNNIDSEMCHLHTHHRFLTISWSITKR